MWHANESSAAVGSSSSASEAECTRHKRGLHSVNVNVSLAVDINDLSEFAFFRRESAEYEYVTVASIEACN